MYRAVVISAQMGFGLFAPYTLHAQRPVSSVIELGGVRLSVSPQELSALSNLRAWVDSDQKGPQDRALAEARRVANGSDARYVLALYELEIGKRRRDDVMRARALDTLIASKTGGRSKLSGYLASRGLIAFDAGDLGTAERVWRRWAELAPADPDALNNLAQVRLAQKDAAGSIDLLTRAIAVRERTGQPASALWYRQRLSIAQQGGLVAPGIDAARTLVAAYPTPDDWRAALVVYRQLAAPEGATEIDLLRLMRHLRVLAQAAEYQRLAQLLRQAGEPREAKSVLDEGIARGLLDTATSPTREIVAEVDRDIAKPHIASPPLNGAGAQVRLGMAQLRAGRWSEAEASFRNAAGDTGGGRYGDLAFFWLKAMARGER